MSQSFTWAYRSLCILVLSLVPLLPLTSQAAPKDEPIDLSIIEQRDALRPYMNAQQRIAYVKAADLIKQGQSNLRSGQNLQLQKPSALDPKRDIRSIHERGKRLEATGQAQILDGQQQMVALLTSVQAQQISARAQAATKYNFTLASKDYQSALEAAAEQTLQACNDAGYFNVFFDGMRILQGDQNTQATATVHNAAYDTLIQIDGTQFSVKVPLSLKLAPNETTAALQFHYDNAAVFAGEQTALLAIELIAPGDGVDALLSLRAFDLNSQQLISSELYYIADASHVLRPEVDTQATTATSAAETIRPTRTIPESVSINDPKQFIDTLAGLPTPYQFETLTTASSSAQAALVTCLLKDTLLKHSALPLVESDYILRTYLPADTNAEDFDNAATAALTLTTSDGAYMIRAESYGSGRSLVVGPLTLHMPEAKEAASDR
jgi:hypothetical protein